MKMKKSHKLSPLRNAARLKTIATTFARYGFQNVLEKMGLKNLGILDRWIDSDMRQKATGERLRMAFDELGPAFVKFGQVLATRPDLIPEDIAEEFKKLQDQVGRVSKADIEQVLTSHFGQPVENVFSEFSWEPLAAASIAQVHTAKLKSGHKVVVKIQRPRIEPIIREDLSILYFLAEAIDAYVPDLKIFNPIAIVDEFAKTLDLETNFIIEANNIRRFQDNFINEPSIKIPKVYGEFSGKKVLVMEFLDGIPLSQKNSLTQEGINPEAVLRVGLRCYLKMVFSDGLFHGDLHAGNMFVLPNNRVGLIDFGVVGRLNKKTQSAIANMLVALASEDYDRLAYEHLDLAPYNENIDADKFARDLRDLIAPYYGLTLKHVNVGKLMMDSTVIAARYGVQLPAELIMFFKSIISIEGMGRVIVNDFNFLAYSLEFAAELVQSRAEPTRVVREMSTVGRDVVSLLMVMPRQIKQIIRKFSSPDFEMKLRVKELDALTSAVKSGSTTVFLGLVSASLILSGTVLYVWGRGPEIWGLPAVSVIHFVIAMGFIFFALFR
jgi:ubiquinone biosynthesis protein